MFLFENRRRRKYKRTVNKAELHPGTPLVMRWDTCAGGCVLLCCWSWHFWGWTVRAHGAQSPSALLSVCEPFIRDLPGQMKSTAHGKSLPNVNPIFMCLVSAFLAAFLPFCLLSWAFVEDVGNGIGSMAAAPHGCWTPVSEGGDTGCLGSAGHKGGEHWEQNLMCLLLHAALKNSVLYHIHCRSIDCDFVGKCSLNWIF